jgi:hypothetical protein
MNSPCAYSIRALCSGSYDSVGRTKRQSSTCTPPPISSPYVHAVPTRKFQSDQSSRQLLRCHICPAVQKNAVTHQDRRLYLCPLRPGPAPAPRLGKISAPYRSLHIRTGISARIAGCANRWTYSPHRSECSRCTRGPYRTLTYLCRLPEKRRWRTLTVRRSAC